MITGSSRRQDAQVWGTASGDDTPIETVARWYRERRAEHAVTEAVDDRTWSDLDMDELFGALDHCRTPIGRQHLYGSLRRVADEMSSEPRDRLVDALAADSSLREHVVRALDQTTGFGGYALYRLVRIDEPGGRWLRFVPGITVVGLLLLALAPWFPITLAAFIPLAALGMFLRFYAIGTIRDYLGPFRELRPTLRAARVLARIEHAQLEPYRDRLRGGEARFERLDRVSRWVSRDVLAGSELVGSLYEYLNIVLLLDANALRIASRDIRRQRAALESLLLALAEIDVAQSIASLRSAPGPWCRPEFCARTNDLVFDELVHPAMVNGVANAVCLPAGRGTLLTGTNMSGKSTLLRTLGTNVILGAALGICRASRAVLPVRKVRTCMAHQDDLQTGRSYFLAEAEAVVEHLRAATREDALCLFDELFRGTNASERIAAAEAVMRHLISTGVEGGPSQFVVLATHDLELVHLLADCFASWHLAVDTTTDEMTFLYRLEAGPAQTRTALTLLKRLGAPAAVVARASARAAALDQQADRREALPS